MLLQSAPRQLLQAGTLAKSVDGDPEAAVACTDLHSTGLGTLDLVGKWLAGIARIRG
ncbi:hypothetical protein D3C78_1812390 [compost metagenome]